MPWRFHGSSRLLMLVVALGAGLPAMASVMDGVPVPELSFYAAASLREVLGELVPGCETSLGVRLVFNYGASSDLARQIEAAGKADLFFSADEAWMDHVERAGLVDVASRRSPLSNRLVVVVPVGREIRIGSAADLAGRAVRRLALANPDAVPAGKYAKAWLLKAGYWERVKDRVVPTLDVRAALAVVETGAVDAGIVYATDAAISRRVLRAYEVPVEDTPRISYALAALANRPHVEASRRVVAWLTSPQALAVFERFGFTVTAPAP